MLRKIIWIAVVLLTLTNLIATVLSAQQPQAQTQPLYAVNAKWVNGVAPGYWPTPGSGLTLNISAGTVNCNSTIVTYAGGTLTMANNTTNYVYLDTTSSCVPASNTSGFDGNKIPVAKVVTSGGVITTVTDDRVSFSTATGTGSLSTTVNGQTCSTGGSCNVNSGAAAHSVALNQGNGNAQTGVGPGTTGQLLRATSSADPTYSDLPEVHMIPAANCPNGVPGSGWSYAASTWTAACRTGTNNLGGALQLTPSTGGAAQFRLEIPADWDSSSQPYIRIEYASGSNTSGTVIWTVASACTKADGSVTDDPAFVAESAFASQTMANANRAWAQTGQFTAITSGNNCVGGGGIAIKLTLSGTASNPINAYQAVVTFNRQIVVQAN